MRKMITLYADEGKVLTNGSEYGTTISLSEGSVPDNYYEITLEEYQEIMATEID
jgi:hypothetical protein